MRTALFLSYASISFAILLTGSVLGSSLRSAANLFKSRIPDERNEKTVLAIEIVNAAAKNDAVLKTEALNSKLQDDTTTTTAKPPTTAISVTKTEAAPNVEARKSSGLNAEKNPKYKAEPNDSKLVAQYNAEMKNLNKLNPQQSSLRNGNRQSESLSKIYNINYDPEQDEFANEFIRKRKLRQNYNKQTSMSGNSIAMNWPDAIVAYVIDENSYDKGVVRRIKEAMYELEMSSCLYFYGEVDIENLQGGSYLYFTNPEKKRECIHDFNWRSGSEVRVVLGYDCLKVRDILHSILHGIGFKDEITHPERDNYVSVLWNNIQPKYRHLFAHQPDSDRAQLDYDPNSIMHFHERAFTMNGQPTIFPVMPGIHIKPSEKLSFLDIHKIRHIFRQECNSKDTDKFISRCEKQANSLNSWQQNKIPLEDHSNMQNTGNPDQEKLMSQNGYSEVEEGVYIPPAKGAVNKLNKDQAGVSDAEEGVYIPPPGKGGNGIQVNKLNKVKGDVSEADEGMYIPPPGKGNHLANKLKGQIGGSNDNVPIYIPPPSKGLKGNQVNKLNKIKNGDVSEADEGLYIPPPGQGLKGNQVNKLNKVKGDISEADEGLYIPPPGKGGNYQANKLKGQIGGSNANVPIYIPPPAKGGSSNQVTKLNAVQASWNKNDQSIYIPPPPPKGGSNFDPEFYVQGSGGLPNQPNKLNKAQNHNVASDDDEGLYIPPPGKGGNGNQVNKMKGQFSGSKADVPIYIPPPVKSGKNKNKPKKNRA